MRTFCRTLVVSAGTALACSSSFAGDSPVFSFSVRPCTTRLEVAPRGPFSRQFELVLSTSDNPSAVGAQGWSLSLGAIGVTVTEITVAGTVAAEVTEDPPGLRDAGFETSEVASGGTGECENLDGAVSAVVLSLLRPVTLPPAGEAVVARITVEGDGPPEIGASAPASLFFVDGCGGSG